jgi:diaminopimelate decarboxylase
MPMSPGFADRLLPIVEGIAAEIPTPFYVYDEAGIVARHREVVGAFGDWPYRQYFAVKALPNPAVLRRLVGEGSGLDCSSPMELELAGDCGAAGDGIIFTSNNTTRAELDVAIALGARITFDDRRYFDRLDRAPDSVCFRLAPPAGGFSRLMGSADDSKFGMNPADMLAGYRAARAAGATRFGIYGMACANELSVDNALAAARWLLDVAGDIESEVGIAFDHVNFGGGIGIPYHPDDVAFDFRLYARRLREMTEAAFAGRRVTILTELGRYITGPHGVLAARVVSRTAKHREIIGIDANMACLARPVLYGAFHHISIPGRSDGRIAEADVVGSMCENGDRFATQRPLPLPVEGDLIFVHDTGAHAHAMGIAYNGRLRPAEVLLRDDGSVHLVRRAEVPADYCATCRDEPLAIRSDAALVGRAAA